ncbi:DUF3509 domain-containing protein [Pseudomonas sp. PDM14]|uniref:DUF3509 domain-containing protein n=1 Tax=Pseudomonas sp. PDM14 TaxID=2769288 RepID=UPI001785A9BE|nr:DUF3509 domain-containing protein [Pseudomonas sp. PDM14]MBD9481499.1 DUF3509 domain-containing protein [Pseudomonas sp. PDM14]
MQIAMKEFFDAFPGYDISIKPRPDGKLVLTLRDGGSQKMTSCKVIERDVVFCEQRVRHLIHEVVREQKLAKGEALCAQDGRWASELPTFTGGPIQQTASKTLVARRRLDAQAAQAAGA